MPRRKENDTEDIPPRRRPATTPDARETQMIALADELAEKQIRSGKVSSQVLTHYLKLGSSRERLEQHKLALETELVRAKTEAIEAQAKSEEMFAKAIKAMSIYQGRGGSIPQQDHFEEEYYETDPDVF